MDPFPFDWDLVKPPEPPAPPQVPQEVPRYGKPIGPDLPEPKWGQAPSAPKPQSSYLDFVRKQEGFNPRAYSDYKQMSIGYGTRARPGESSITREEAERRLGEELESARKLVRGFGVKLSPRQEDALTDLTYNAGGSWMTSGLGAAVKAGDWQRAADIFRQYNKAGGQTLPGLVNRRNAAAPWLLDTSGVGEQITAQGMLPTSTPVAAAPQQGRGMIDTIKGWFAPQQSANPTPPTAESIIASLDRLGVAKDDPMRGTYEFMAHSLAGGRQPQPPMTPVQAGFGTFLDVLGAGLGRRGGNSAAAPVLPDMMKQRSAERQKLEERQYQAPLALLQAIMPYRMKEIERQRREATMKAILGGGTQPAQVAPGGAQGVQMPSQAPLVPGPVERAELPPPGASATSIPVTPPPGIAVAPPALTGQAPGAPAPTPAAGPAAAPGAPPGPQESRPLKYRGAADPALIAEMDRLYPMPDENTIRALTAGGYDKEADNMRQLMELRLKQREQFLKMHEQQRADDPVLAGEKTEAQERAKKKVELDHARTIAQQGGKSMVAGVERLKAIPGWAGDSFEKTIGPFDNFTGPYGALPIGPAVGYLSTLGKDVGTTQVRDAIKADVRAMMMKAKEMVRGPGEGVWTDADQRNLDEIAGDILGSRDRAAYDAAVGNIAGRIYDIYLAPKGIKREDIGLPAQDERRAARAPQITPEQQAKTKERYQAADPATKAAIEKQLREMGFDPAQVLGGASPSNSGSLADTLRAASVINPVTTLGGAAGQAIYNSIPSMPAPPISTMEGF
jgi:lysozyme